jgi:hypothetical protein
VSSGSAFTYTVDVPGTAGAPAATYGFPTGDGSPGVRLTIPGKGGASGSAMATLTIIVGNARRPPACEPPPDMGRALIRTAGVTIGLGEAAPVSGRVIKVPVTADRPRTVSVTLETAKRGRELAQASLRLKHAGDGLVQLRLPKKIKPGDYVIAVRVATPGGKRVGKTVRRPVTLSGGARLN